MNSEIDVANLALTALGKPLIASLSEATPTAAIARQNLPIARRSQLSRSDWIFARKTKPLVRVVDSSEFGEGWYSFARPADFLKLRAVSGPDGMPYHPGRWRGPEFRMNGIYVNVEGEAATVSYIYDNTSVHEWPPLFSEAVAYKLAALMATSITGRPRDATEAASIAEAQLLRAIETDAAQERSTYARRGPDDAAGPLTQQWPIVSYDGSTFWDRD